MRDFSFLFYPGDVLRDVQFFNKKQKGCYLEVLTSHLEHPRFSQQTLLKITAELSDFERAEFLQIFDKDDDGYFICWAESAIEKRSAYLLSREKNRKSTKKEKKEKGRVVAMHANQSGETANNAQPISEPQVPDMENKNENENENENESKYGNVTENGTEKKLHENQQFERSDTQRTTAKEHTKNPLRDAMREHFLQAYQRKKGIAFAWDLRHNLHVDEIIPKIRAVTLSTDEDVVLKFWDTLIENIPDWYFANGFSPSMINTKFNEIVAKIHKPTATNSAAFLDAQLREIAARGNPYARPKPTM